MTSLPEIFLEVAEVRKEEGTNEFRDVERQGKYRFNWEEVVIVNFAVAALNPLFASFPVLET